MSEAADGTGQTQDPGTEAAVDAGANIGAEGGAKPAEGAAPAASTDGAKPADAKPAAVVEYGDFTAPEGVKLDADTMTAFKDLAKAKGLTQEEAQAFVDLGAKNALNQAKSLQEAAKKTVADWAAEAKADKEFGGEKFDANVAIAKKGLDAVGNDKLKALLKESGIGSHPEVIRAFFKIGKMVSEDTTHTGRTAAPSKSLAETLYGTSS